MISFFVIGNQCMYVIVNCEINNVFYNFHSYSMCRDVVELTSYNMHYVSQLTALLFDRNALVVRIRTL